jgi:hypothetical protein
MNIRSGSSAQCDDCSGVTPFSRLSSHPKVTWALTAVLTAGLLAGCGSDKVTGPEGETAPSLKDARTAVPPEHWADGYVWANQPTSASYTPNTAYSFNRSGGSILITKPAGTTGQYTVRFNGLSPLLGAKSTVKVTGYGSTGNEYCKPSSPRLASNVVKIRCFRGNTGAPVNAYYTVLITKNYVENAFAHGNLPTENNYAPQANASWNPAGAVRVFKSGTGVYSVRFSGLGSRLTANGGHAQVVAVGTGSQHCKVSSWGGSPDLFVGVLCFTKAGTPVNVKFNLLFLMPHDHLGYAWANSPSSPSYTPSGFYSWNSGGGTVRITRSAPGKYQVTFNGLSADLFDGGDVQVTAYGGGNTQCKVEFWSSESVNVRCHRPSGLVDSYFNILYGS